MQAISRILKSEGKTLGLVPTMGFLHEGHLSLVRAAKAQNDITIVSIFVNPTQFGPNEDLSRYPRDFERDAALLEGEGVDIIFYPTPEDIYGPDFSSFITVENISALVEGEFRPTHFKGVTTVVAILFNATLADHAYFGQKDAQQATILSKMQVELCFPIEVHVMPIVREEDGLALSSRNIYLGEQERKDAVVLSQSLQHAKIMLLQGERRAATIQEELVSHINQKQTAVLDYVKVVSAGSFLDAEVLEAGKRYFVLLACRFGKARLIDNLFVDLTGETVFFQ